ncbi:hypothetical protein yc1106_03393 [Curvularia clavata]|uniref:Uncharacterized protein n=1 Tax=Curvularia clavata TaxID=95742 RepID=A0A9Q9DRW2_CURCL|nr:hypothetical protein yc1106_03393 [Curvularia clavata]
MSIYDIPRTPTPKPAHQLRNNGKDHDRLQRASDSTCIIQSKQKPRAFSVTEAKNPPRALQKHANTRKRRLPVNQLALLRTTTSHVSTKAQSLATGSSPSRRLLDIASAVNETLRGTSDHALKSVPDVHDVTFEGLPRHEFQGTSRQPDRRGNYGSARRHKSIILPMVFALAQDRFEHPEANREKKTPRLLNIVG